MLQIKLARQCGMRYFASWNVKRYKSRVWGFVCKGSCVHMLLITQQCMFLFTVFACMFACIYSRHYRSFSFKFALRSSSPSTRMPEFTRSPIHSLSLFLCISTKCHSRQRQVWKHWWQKCCCFTPSWIVIEKKTSNNSNGMQNGWVAPHVHNTLKPYSVHIVFGIYRHPTHKKRTQRNSCKLREWSRRGRKRKVYT